MAPLATAPRAYADIDDLITQPIAEAIDQALSLIDPSLLGAADPGLDVDSLLTPALAAVDPANMPGLSDPLPSLDALLADWFQELEQSWISSPLGQAIDNGPAAAFTSPDDGAWGWLFGDSAAAIGGTTVGAANADAGAAAASGTDAPTTASVPLQVDLGTEPVVDISVGGGTQIPVVVDTGSEGLVIPWYDLGLQDLGFPTGLGIGAYSGGLDYLYVTVPTTVSFGDGITTAQTPVDVELFSFPTSLSSFFDGSADGVLGIGPNAIGPGPSSVISALPGDLSQGVLIDQANDTLQFGPDPLTGGVSVAGAPDATLEVSINGGPPQSVSAVIDSGGVYGTLPSSLFGGSGVGEVLKPGTEISVYNQDGDLLYSYTVTATNSPTVTSGSTMDTGNIPFQQQPVYISNSPTGQGTTIFGGTS